MSTDYNSLNQIFSHPLVLLLIGVAISGVLIPYFTNRAAKYQKGLEIKTDLVRRINESVMPIVTCLNALLYELGFWTSPSGGFYSQRNRARDQLEEIEKELHQVGLEESRKKILEQKQKEVSQNVEIFVQSISKIENLHLEVQSEYRRWLVSGAVIGSQIKSYFPELGKETDGILTWNAFEKTVDEAYGSAGVSFGTVADGVNNMIWREEFCSKIQHLIDEKDQIIIQIQNSPVSGLSEPLFRRFIRRITGKGKVK